MLPCGMGNRFACVSLKLAIACNYTWYAHLVSKVDAPTLVIAHNLMCTTSCVMPTWSVYVLSV